MNSNYGIASLLRDSSTIIEIISAIIGSFYIQKYKNSILIYFLFYLWIIVILECTGYILREYFNLNNTSIIYNVFSVMSFSYLFFLYWKVIKNTIRKIWIKYFFGIYIISLLIGSLIENYLYELQIISYIVGSFLLILAILFYFIEILNNEKVLYIKKNLLFWISVGYLLFSAGCIPFTLTFNYYAKAGGMNFLFSIHYILIILLNICFIIGFVCSDKKQLY